MPKVFIERSLIMNAGVYDSFFIVIAAALTLATYYLILDREQDALRYFYAHDKLKYYILTACIALLSAALTFSGKYIAGCVWTAVKLS